MKEMRFPFQEQDIRSNQLAKCTVVSTLPFSLDEPKPGLIPDRYIVPAAAKDDISTLIINDGFHLVLIPMTDSKTPPMKVTDTAEVIAKSLIEDFTIACLGTNFVPDHNGMVAKPGLFWVEGAKQAFQIKKDHAKELEIARNNTIAWFGNLVRMADDDWTKFHSHRMITDLQRTAARYLGMEGREWNFDAREVANNVCWACKSPINPTAIICHSCKAILNQDEYNKRKADFVGV